MSCALQIEGKTLPQQNDYDSFYWDTCFIVVVWNRTGNISKVHLYVRLIKSKSQVQFLEGLFLKIYCVKFSV